MFDPLQTIIDTHRWHSQSALLLGQSLRQQFPEVCPWQLDLFQRRFAEQLEKLETWPEHMEGLPWTTQQRKARRQLTRTVKRRWRGELRTALEVWSVSCAYAAAAEVRAAKLFANNFSPQR